MNGLPDLPPAHRGDSGRIACDVEPSEEDGRLTDIPVAGAAGGNTMTFNPGPSLCGGIVDGVSLNICDRGPIVIRFGDLRRMYVMAAERRRQVLQ